MYDIMWQDGAKQCVHFFFFFFFFFFFVVWACL